MLVRPRPKTHSMLENIWGENMKKTNLFDSRHVRVQGTKQITQRFSGERGERTSVQKGWVFGFTKRGSLRCRYPRKKREQSRNQHAKKQSLCRSFFAICCMYVSPGGVGVGYQTQFYIVIPHPFLVSFIPAPSPNSYMSSPARKRNRERDLF
jgi:hypothetical protein